MLGTKIGIDIGSSSILAIVEGKGVRINEPSVIAYDTFTGKIKAIGSEAYQMIGKNPDSLTVIRPMRDGTVFDFDALQNLLCIYIQKVCGNKIFKPNVIVCIPSGVTDLDKRTILDLTTSAGAARACVIEEPLAAALGADIGSQDNHGKMIVDIGGGTTDIAVITGGCVAVSGSLNIAGKTFDDDICRFARRERDTIIGSVTAETVKKQVGATKFLDAELATRAVGKDYITKLPKSIELSSTDIFLCIREHLDQIVENIRLILEKTPPELNADVSVNGIILTGGGALLRGIDEYIENKIGIHTSCAENPELCVVNGIGVMLKDMKVLEENGYVFKSNIDIKDYED